MDRPDEVCKDDDEFEAYRKRMMLAYRFRPNPLVSILIIKLVTSNNLCTLCYVNFVLFFCRIILVVHTIECFCDLFFSDFIFKSRATLLETVSDNKCWLSSLFHHLSFYHHYRYPHSQFLYFNIIFMCISYKNLSLFCKCFKHLLTFGFNHFQTES